MTRTMELVWSMKALGRKSLRPRPIINTHQEAEEEPTLIGEEVKVIAVDIITKVIGLGQATTIIGRKVISKSENICLKI